MSLGHGWHQAGPCNGGNCVQARAAGGLVQVRDSKDPGGAVLSFTRAEWAAFLGRVRAS